VPYLGPLARWVETLKRPKRALIVDVPIEMDDGASPTSRATACSTT
jgi:glutamate dehydrogenase (NAD(P)+)